MPIAKKPSGSVAPPPAIDEKQIEQFIGRAGKGDEPVPLVDTRKKPTPVRFDPDMYARIEAAAKRRGLSRAAWVRYVVSQALEVEEGR